MGKLLGGSKSKSTSSNQAYPFLQQQFGGTTGATGNASSMISALLGLGGDTGAAGDAFNNYQDSIGYDFIMDQGQRAITGSNAAKGLLNSGATGKALTQYGQNLGKSTFNDYLGSLFNLGNMGIQAGNVISGAGGQSQSTSKQKNGLGGVLGGLASNAALSDRRVKKDIKELGEFSDGLKIYSYTYKWDSKPQLGVMADEVEVLRPWALGPEINGYKTVDYGRL